MLHAFGSILGFTGAVTLFIYGLLLASHRPFQDWKYRRETGSIDKSSQHYRQAISNMMIAGSGAALGGLLIALLILATNGFLG